MNAFSIAILSKRCTMLTYSHWTVYTVLCFHCCTVLSESGCEKPSAPSESLCFLFCIFIWAACSSHMEWARNVRVFGARVELSAIFLNAHKCTFESYKYIILFFFYTHSTLSNVHGTFSRSLSLSIFLSLSTYMRRTKCHAHTRTNIYIYIIIWTRIFHRLQSPRDTQHTLTL